MRDIARLAALVVAALVLWRNVAVAGYVPAITVATYIAAFVVLLALTLFRDGFVTASAVALGAHYAVALKYGDVTADYGAPVVAALVVVHLELLDLAAAVPGGRAVDVAFLKSRARHVGLVFLIGVTAAVLPLLVATVRWPSATLTRALGVVGVGVAVAAIPLGLQRARR